MLKGTGMPRKTKDIVARAERIANAWKSCHQEKKFSGLTLNAFMDALKPSREVRTELAEIATRRRLLLQRRRNSDNLFKPTLLRIVHSVRGDPDVGEDDPMYSSMGYVSKSRRRKPGRKKKKTPKPKRA
jgi:hypothetical protein